MSERYSKLFALLDNLYAAGSPVVIAAGALLKDNQNGKVLAQLKIRNIGAKSIKAAKVTILPLDTVGKPLGGEVEYQYLDLDVARDKDFGQKSPITLSDASTRGYAASVTEVIFTDNTLWKSTGESWEPLTAPATLDSVLVDRELVKQYRIKYGADCKYEPATQKDLWYCVCGGLNRKEESVCHSCQKSAESLMAMDLNALKKERDSRIAAEQQKAAEEKAVADAKAKKAKKLAMILAPIVIVAIVASVLISGSVKKSNAYENALLLLEAEQYAEAIEAFTALGDYKDSAEQIQAAEAGILEQQKAAAYADAIALLKAGKYSEAYDAFFALGDYKDCAEYLERCSQPYVLLSESVTYNGSEKNHEITYLYDRGVLVKETIYVTGTTLASFHGIVYDENKSGYAEYKYDANGNISEICVYNNAGTLVKHIVREYDDKDNMIRESTECPLHDDVDTFTYTYDENGNLIQRLWYQNLTGTGNIYSKHNYKYDEHNQLIAEDWSYESSGTTAVKYENEYDNNGRLISQSASNGKTYYYEYDGNGNLLLERVTGEQGNYENRYEYDEFGNIIKEEYISNDTDTKRTTTYTYGYVSTAE